MNRLVLGVSSFVLGGAAAAAWSAGDYPGGAAAAQAAKPAKPDCHLGDQRGADERDRHCNAA